MTEFRHVHIVGVCGTLMGAFAAYLRETGVRVTGSDQNIYPPMSDVLRDAGVELRDGYRPENLEQPDLVVIGNVIRKDNPEARAAIDNGMKYTSLPEFMENHLLGATRNIVVSGTHGKTTTSSMMAHVLQRCGEDPSFFIGGVVPDLNKSFHVTDITQGRPFVLEGDEYDTAFWDKVPKFDHYLPSDLILTSVEFDHADIYPDMASIEAVFARLITEVRRQVVAAVDDPGVVKLISLAKVPVHTYGIRNPKATHRATIRETSPQGTRFEVHTDGKIQDEILIALKGDFNVLNALAVWVEAQQLGLDPEKVRQALADFRGVRRRQEVRAEIDGITIIDDFAHHPTAVAGSVQAFRKVYPARRLVIVFEPRSATSRRAIFQKAYAESFAGADRVWIAPPYDQSQIDESDRFSAERLLSDLGKQKISASLLSEGKAVDDVFAELQSGDVVAVLSNGGFGGMIPQLIQKLENRIKSKP